MSEVIEIPAELTHFLLPSAVQKRLQFLLDKHFEWNGVRVNGLTATGRATIDVSRINRALILAIRAEEELLGRHLPL